MSLISRFGRMCPTCHKPHRTVFGSAQWHARNDPPGGYCYCDLDPIPGAPRAQAPADAVTCAVCNGAKVVGIPGAPCPKCKGSGWDEVATQAQRLSRAEED